MKDRIPTKPGRVKVTREDGTSEYVILERADEPTEEGTALNKETILKDETAAFLGLGEDAVPNDAFLRLAFGIGNYGVHIYVKLPDGTPASGVKIAGVTNLVGGALTTDFDGYCFGITKNNPASISATTTWADIKSTTRSFDLSDPISTVTLIMGAKSEKEATYTSSATIMFSSLVKLLDICAVGGGGGGGGAGGYNKNIWYYGGGGGGGYVFNKLGIKNIPNTAFSIRIGSGGSAGVGSNSGTSKGRDGATGGTTEVTYNGNKMLANGGSGGIGGGGTSTSASGGSGNGRGGSGGVNGQGTSGVSASSSSFKFEESSLGLAGGGGGGGGSRSEPVSSGGSPNGGSGGCFVDTAQAAAANGLRPGGGGGGAAKSGTSDFGGTGGNGIVYIRWHY